MKNQQSLLALAIAGVAIAFTSGCASSSQPMGAAPTTDKAAATRWVGATGWSPITDIRQMNKFPMSVNPVIYRTTTLTVPVAASDAVELSSSNLPTFNEDLEPGEAFVEAAGAAPTDAKVKRVILYSPFSGPGRH